MSVLDWSFVSLLAAALLFVVFGVLALGMFIRTNGKWRQVKRKRPPKNKKKRRRFIQMKRQLEKQRKSQLVWLVVFLLIGGLSGGGAAYTRYYQQNHLQAADSEVLVQSYYLLDELTTQLDTLEQGETPEKTRKNIMDLSGRLASYGTRKAYLGLTEDNQKLLNRHFTLLREFGTNLNSSSRKLETIENAEILAGYKSDLEKAKESQATVFKQFNVNEAALKQKQ